MHALCCVAIGTRIGLRYYSTIIGVALGRSPALTSGCVSQQFFVLFREECVRPSVRCFSARRARAAMKILLCVFFCVVVGKRMKYFTPLVPYRLRERNLWQY